MGKQPYELSVWRDAPIAGTLETDGYFTDEKVAIIGSDSMDSPLKAYDVSLKELTMVIVHLPFLCFMIMKRW